MKLSAFVIAILISNVLGAAETDQFYAAKAVIRDSSNEMNDYFNQKIELGLDISNHKKEVAECVDVAEVILTQVLGEFSIKEYVKDLTFSKVSYFTQHSPLIERFPDDSMKGQDYRAQSIYKHRPFPTNVVGIARTININGIFIGTDKIGHFSIIGRSYYKNFRQGLADGLTPDQAQVGAIKSGFKQEVGTLGYNIGGTLAYGDLEANYQGLQFARNMCEGKTPHLVQLNGHWVHNPANLFDIKKYVTPRMDEAFNVSLWAPRVWKKMKKEIIIGYCQNKIEPSYKARVEEYSKVLKSTINDELIEQFVKENPKFDRAKQLLDKKITCLDPDFK